MGGGVGTRDTGPYITGDLHAVTLMRQVIRMQWAGSSSTVGLTEKKHTIPELMVPGVYPLVMTNSLLVKMAIYS